MTPQDFIAKWRAAELKESSAAQEHFIDLCRLLGEPTPAEADPKGEWYCFERGATKTTGGEGWADVWKREHFGWEYKGKRKDLTAAFVQLQQYAIALENPPLLVVCGLDRFEIHTNWTNSVSRIHRIGLDELRDGAVRDTLKAVFSDPEKLNPGKTRQSLTEDAAKEFAGLAQRLREKGHAPGHVAHFINRLVFCMFAEDIGLLPDRLFEKMLLNAKQHPEDFQALASTLFGAMRGGGRVGFERVDWFNGGLFDDDSALALDKWEIDLVVRAAKLDWEEIDPSILGTLFERGLDPDKRSQLGAHYTDRDKIMLIIEPVIRRSLLAEWQAVKAQMGEPLAKADAARKAGNKAAQTKAHDRAVALYRAFLDRLRQFTVLDPACGSGNFLYLALKELKDIEHQCMIEAEAMGIQREFPQIGPASVKGIEINQYAAELARVTVWIGEIQWMRRNGFNVTRDPILKPLETIENRDAVLNADGTEASWPKADVIIGNPPFLGDKLMISTLGEDYVAVLRQRFEGRVPGGADLVCYWFEKAGAMVRSGEASAAGLVATNSIRRRINRQVLDRIIESVPIFEAWSDEPWVVEGAAVRVSIICFGSRPQGSHLDGSSVVQIHSDLTQGTVDLTSVSALRENSDVAFIGTQKNGPFEIEGQLARDWLVRPHNPNGKPNRDVVRPWANGMDIVGRPSDTWIIDFGPSMTEQAAALYEAPFAHVLANVRPTRVGLRRQGHRLKWWIHGEARPGMRLALGGRPRYIVTPRVAKYRLFVWLVPAVLPDTRLVVVARDDDTTFGLVHSRFHEAWSLRLGGRHGVGNDPQYTPSSAFESFPFPDGLTPNRPATQYANDPRALRIANAARKLNELRENWLNPPDLVKRVPEVVPGFPDRILPVDDKAAEVLKKRTLTNLYNERPAWLDHAHKDLDAAVAAAYGWPEDISEEDALARLFALNQERAAAGR